MLLVSDEPKIRELGKLHLQLKHFYRSYVEVMTVANPHMAPLLTRIRKDRQAMHFYAHLNKLSYGTAWTSYGTVLQGPLFLSPLQGFELRTSICTFVIIQRFCRCRYLEVPMMAKLLYIHIDSLFPSFMILGFFLTCGLFPLNVIADAFLDVPLFFLHLLAIFIH